jgi:glycosyltransferase involved in cell wall biosynthesis
MTLHSDISCVITSCNRIALLRQTIQSLTKYYKFAEIIIVEDGNADLPEFETQAIKVIYNSPKLGQIRSIDKAYSLVETPYIFHCEDDWEFYRGGFIEESKVILETYPSVLQVHIREQNEMNSHPIVKLNNTFDLVDTNYKWRGFSFNPGLRRLKDYTPYTKIVANPSVTSSPKDEQKIGEYYYEKGYITAILKQGAVRHIGQNQSTHR